MSQPDAHGHHEIIIVRHGHGDHDEGHHGGVWKIAFADFMTAMMCFFLVMWLINASNEETKAAVASYFNPVKLVDRNASRKSLEEVSQDAVPQDADNQNESTSDGGEAEKGPSKNEGTVDASEIKKEADEKLFSDPYAVLAEIASETGIKQNISDKGEGGVQNAGPATGASGGEAYRDPFAPDFWSQQVALPTEAEASAEPQETPRQDEPPVFESGDPALEESQARPAEPVPQGVPPETIKTADQIRAEIAEALLAADGMKDNVTVTATDRGVQVSVTDQLDFGMFEIGSAVPRRELVLAMEKIGKALAGQKGTITVSGHTDGRPFRNAAYDNWRLSTARAHSAYYMLVRGGLDETRITEVSGYADRKLKLKDDPLSAANRRIEILLEVPG
jgi:chemotaxis protein MotB